MPALSDGFNAIMVNALIHIFGVTDILFAAMEMMSKIAVSSVVFVEH